MTADAVFVQQPNVEAQRAEWMKKHIGVFKTECYCNCLPGRFVTDHASILPFNVPMSEKMFGPGRDNYGQDSFTPPQLQHEYYCDSCGAMYHPSVIEKFYTPREKRK